jgi:hypothetical protein
MNLGKLENLLNAGHENAAQVTLSDPVLSDYELRVLQATKSLKLASASVVWNLTITSQRALI